MMQKIDYSKYKDKYRAKLNAMLHTSPNDIGLESMRAYIYGYTFIDDYAKGVFSDEMSMDYWNERSDDTYYGTETDMYEVSTTQERKLLEAIDSTGDGKTPETALCVIAVGQVYEYLQRVFPYSILQVKRQSVSDGIDCLEFKENAFGIGRIYFDISRRFEVGYEKKLKNNINHINHVWKQKNICL